MDFTFLALRAFKPLHQNGDDVNLKGTDYFGVPTLTSLAFQYKDKKLELLECIITVNQEKNIITTPMQGRDGTIKEYISDGDYSISVDAAVCNYVVNQNDIVDFEQSHAYPLEKLDELISFLKIKDTLAVQNDFLTLFGIKSTVVKNYGMVQETHANRQAFNIQMLSDTPFEIKIKQDVAINK